MISDLVTFSDLVAPLELPEYDSGYVTTLTRGKMATTGNTTPQPRLWSGNVDCNALTTLDTSITCVLGGGHSTLANISWLEDPFFSPLPSGFSTGLVKQFAPRINSTARRENITADEFPKQCDQIPGALYIRYANSTNLSYTSETYSVEVCMPANMSASPWKAQYERQDFSEELYLNISLYNFSSSITSGTYYSKITLNTTGGFFELPNYMNGEVAGPLIQDDPSNYCGTNCEPQGYGNPVYDHNITSRSLSNTSVATGANATQELMLNVNKGPLLTVALALFGMGSFIDTRQSYEAYAATIASGKLYGQCLSLVPFISLVRDYLDQTGIGDPLDPCLAYEDRFLEPIEQVAYYLWAFVWNSYDWYRGERIQNAFASSAFLANEAWMMSSFTKDFWVSYDLGGDTQIPVLSRPGMILISAMLGIFLAWLFAMAFYAAWGERWTEQLDSFSMMRIGSAMGESVPLMVARSVDKIKVLDEVSGSIGDATNGEGNLGELGVGAQTVLKRGRQYRGY
jgi:hypothetical protein